MAKKRGAISPLGNTVGSQEAQKNAAKANLESLTRQLSSELEKAGESTQAFLESHFGLGNVGKPVEWRLASGDTAVFHEIMLTYDEVKANTFVTFDINGRDQSQLTRESLMDLNSLAYQQFYPAVGREVDGKIDILDGSRRRAWFLLQQGKVAQFRVLVTKETLSVSDAKALAKQLQTAKEHNQREIGLQCVTIMNNEQCTQEDVAKMLGMSRQSVGRAIKAASIDERLIALFPVVNELSHTDYAVLDKAMKHFAQHAEALTAFIQRLEHKVALSEPHHELISTKEWLLSVIQAELKVEIAKTRVDDVTVTPLVNFASKGMFARKRSKGRNFSYEFGRLPKSVQTALDDAISSVLDDYQQSE
ncbi:ParB family protein [Vibrio ouci]|uniref:ParB/RepB/Spo0J family partition protein n=1 Tax=Vibrio ouci TaxID=2499078 RepID=A0A4Y8W9U5_9VIBR|nr:ParB family protein [Vibrio ouci]TFH89699.1 ParB/RepB/Spo0J family partition protein [Vibrio ouci]